MTDTVERIDIQYAVTGGGIPPAETIRAYAQHALKEAAADNAELCVRVVDEAEITALNSEYRGKAGATNVLSFPYEPMPGVSTGLIGDVVICAPVVAAEAIAQGKSLEAHWAHIVIHGVLHLLGHDHREEAVALAMEDLERRLLAGLGYADPYRPAGTG
ncbi:MAG: rRNA maturation RNase YbeY [Gammaproteobacteria bacterium]|nr:rRNA maturation RNase YbeY [Gammaproteobacteria bacterium]